MKILLINKFLYPKGGDAICALSTGELLFRRGHEVAYWGMHHPDNPSYPYNDYFVDNIDFNSKNSLAKQFKMSADLLYSLEAKGKIEKLLRIIKPDIVHLNNFAHQISPSILHVFRKNNIPLVMTMHDYKLVCASYALLSRGRVCQKCGNGKYYYCFLEGCSKDSMAKSLLNTIEMYLHHKILHIYDSIDIFISPSLFLKNKLEEMRFNKKIVYLPNFINLEHFSPRYDWEGGTVIYFGRLSKEKGLFTLIEAVKDISSIVLKIVGEGPIKERLERKAQSAKLYNVEFTGHLSGEELKDEIKKSMFVILPSECYENNPRSIIESFALGKPALGAMIGGIPELIKDGETGLTFEPGNAEDLCSKVEYLINNPAKISEMGKKARLFAEEYLGMEKHYERLMEIYGEAKQRKDNFSGI